MSYKTAFKPSARYRELAITTEGGDAALVVKVRADLTFGETNTLVFAIGDKTADQWDKLAPFVVDWNLVDAEDKAVPPPAEAGGKVFELIPNEFFWLLWNTLKKESSGIIDSKSLTEYASMAVLSKETNSENA